MSRVGKQSIALSSQVAVTMDDTGLVHVKGPKGSLQRDTHGRVVLDMDKEKGLLFVQLAQGEHSKYWGLYRTLIANMVEGVTQGYTRSLELQGTGYRASMSGKNLALVVGFSHPVNLEPPAGLVFEVDKTGKIIISGMDKENVGQMAAKVRGIRPPEPYHGKGIRYSGEVIVTKQGKSASKK